MKSKKLILIPAILFVLIAVVFAACKKSGVDPIVVTDANGVPVTDENGKQIEVVPETEIVVVTDENGVPVTDENGKEVTTIRYIPQEVGIPVTDENGNAASASVEIKCKMTFWEKIIRFFRSIFGLD